MSPLEHVSPLIHDLEQHEQHVVIITILCRHVKVDSSLVKFAIPKKKCLNLFVDRNHACVEVVAMGSSSKWSITKLCFLAMPVESEAQIINFLQVSQTTNTKQCFVHARDAYGS